MSTTHPIDKIEEMGARKSFLRLRRLADMPDGGEVTLKEEVKAVADALYMDYDDDWTKRRLIFEIVQEHYYGWSRTWEEAQEACRDYDYIQSREADAVADALEEIQRFEWQ